MATKLEEEGKALVAGPLTKNNFFGGFPYVADINRSHLKKYFWIRC